MRSTIAIAPSTNTNAISLSDSAKLKNYNSSLRRGLPPTTNEIPWVAPKKVSAKFRTCPRCSGSGVVFDRASGEETNTRCHKCLGSGYIKIKSNIGRSNK
jgi:ribosomal protein S27E